MTLPNQHRNKHLEHTHGYIIPLSLFVGSQVATGNLNNLQTSWTLPSMVTTWARPPGQAHEARLQVTDAANVDLAKTQRTLIAYIETYIEGDLSYQQGKLASIY